LLRSAVTFVPPLPEEKRRSIDRLGCGTFNTVVLFFSTIFWDKQAFWLGRADDHQGRSYLYLSMTKVFGYRRRCIHSSCPSAVAHIGSLTDPGPLSSDTPC
jgi:hypothetical protein